MNRENQSIWENLFDIFNVIIITLVSFVMIYPFINQLAISFNDGSDAARGGIYFLPRKFTLQEDQFVYV